MDVIEVLKTPRIIIFKLGIKGYIKCWDDEKYLKLMYWAKFGKKLDIKNPSTFNEKLQWLKLHNKKEQEPQSQDML